MFVVLKPKKIIVALLVVMFSAGVTFGLYSFVSARSTNPARFDYTIAIDAGHGGIDGGCVGDNTQAKESDLNLVIAKKLKMYLSDFGFKVVLTRTTSDGLYSNSSTNKKRDDMEKRAKIIDKNNCDMVVSIHMNYFPDSSVHGAQTFYTTKNPDSKVLSNAIQTQLNKQLQPDNTKVEQIGDYYMLEVLQLPATIVECGFLSNPTEEILLQDDEYQNKITYAIFAGIVSYFGINHNIENVT